MEQQSKIQVGYLGPEGTFSEGVARRYFGDTAIFVPLPTFEDIFDTLHRRDITHAVVPTESSTGGSLHQTLDCVTNLSNEVVIVQEILQGIRLNLLSRSGDIKEVREVQAHPQALSQAQLWLKSNLPRVPQLSASSNAHAAVQARENRGTAAIASMSAAKRNGLKVVSSDIHDYKSNKTRFWVIQNGSSQSAPMSEKTKTSFMFTIKHEAGALVNVLKPLLEHGINMVHIESRPLHGQPWHYRFFIDVAIDVEQPAMQQAIKEMVKHCDYFQMLGSYPEIEYDAI